MSLLAAGLWGCASGTSSGFDPVTQDPPSIDLAFPPLIATTPFEVEGANLNGITYVAQGEGPHPTVVLLHGFPGNEKNLDLAQAIRRAGWNVVVFHYRGAWGSGGDFAFDHVLEDVAQVVAQVRDEPNASSNRVDPDRVVLVGHSMGGFAALLSGAKLESVGCVASVAGANLGGTARALRSSPEQTQGLAQLLDSWSGPLKGASGLELVTSLIEGADRFDTLQAVPGLSRIPVLLMAGEVDAVTPKASNHEPMVAAFGASPGASVSHLVVPGADHSFSGQRILLARRLIEFLEGACTDGLTAASR